MNLLRLGRRGIFPIMNAPLPSAIRFDIKGLAQAITHCQASDALQCQFSSPHWDILGAFMLPFSLNSGQILMEQGANDSTLYFIESGSLSAHYEDEKARIRMALVGPGTVLGEGSFFSQQPRRATVHASTQCKLWCLTPMRFRELASRHSPIALELTLALGSVLAKRLCIRPKRAAVT